MEDFTRFYTAESVTQGHPDKVCDCIADAILDAYLHKDKNARVACEVMITKGHIIIAGEITSDKFVDIAMVVSGMLSDIGYDPRKFIIDLHLHRQSSDIAGAVNAKAEEENKPQLRGAGDQGVMVGYACTQTKEYMPLPVVLSHNITELLTKTRKLGIIKGIKADGKAQVTVEYENGMPLRIDSIVVSIQHDANKAEDELFYEITDKVLPYALKNFPMDENTRLMVKPSGRFVSGGPEADTGLTGRKLMVDNYGTFAPHGGGAFSGKDPTKVDRSGAYMARYIAKNIVASGLARECTVTLAYAIGIAEPVMVEVDTHDSGVFCADDCLAMAVKQLFDLTPDGIIDSLQLTKPIYQQTAMYGPFGDKNFAWEKIDKAEDLRKAVI